MKDGVLICHAVSAGGTPFSYIDERVSYAMSLGDVTLVIRDGVVQGYCAIRDEFFDLGYVDILKITA